MSNEHQIKNGYLKTKYFQWLIGIMITVLIIVFGVIGSSISAVDNKTEKNEDIIHEINVSLGKIETKVDTINKNIDKLLK